MNKETLKKKMNEAYALSVKAQEAVDDLLRAVEEAAEESALTVKETERAVMAAKMSTEVVSYGGIISSAYEKEELPQYVLEMLFKED